MATTARTGPNAETTPLPADIRRFLSGARRRLRLRAALSGGGYGLGAGLALGLAIALATRLRPWLLPDQTALAALVAILATSLLGALAAATRPLPLHAIAARCDHDFGLRERLATALELADGSAHSVLAARHLDETARLVSERSPSALSLPRPGRDTLLQVGALAVALVLLLTLPNGQTAAVKQGQANQQLVQAAAQQVAQVGARVEGRTDLDPATKAAIQQQLTQLQQELIDGKIDPAQAVARIAQTEAELRRLQDPAAVNRGGALPKLAEEFGTFGATAPIGQKLDAGDYAGAGQALKDFGAQLPNLDPASRAALAQKLREAAASQAAADPKLAQQLQDAADAIERGDLAAAQAALDAAGEQIAQTGGAVAAQNTVGAVLGDLGAIKRDVANGQSPSTANATPQRPTGSPIAINGTPATLNGTPFALNGTPITINGTPAVLGQGTPVRPVAGTPPPNATPVIVQGQGGQQGQGQGQGTSQGQGSGQGQGQGQSPGQGGNGSGGSGYGSGSSSGQSGPANGSQPAGNPQGGTGGVSQPPAAYDPVYAPTLPGGAPGQQQQIPGSGGAGAPPSGTTPGQGANAPATVPYDQVYGRYRDQAQQAIDNGAIPPELRDYVQQYFSDLDPTKRK